MQTEAEKFVIIIQNATCNNIKAVFYKTNQKEKNSLEK